MKVSADLGIDLFMEYISILQAFFYGFCFFFFLLIRFFIFRNPIICCFIQFLFKHIIKNSHSFTEAISWIFLSLCLFKLSKLRSFHCSNYFLIHLLGSNTIYSFNLKKKQLHKSKLLILTAKTIKL